MFRMQFATLLVLLCTIGLATTAWSQQAPPEKHSCKKTEVLTNGKCVDAKKRPDPSLDEKAQTGPEKPGDSVNNPPQMIARCALDEVVKDGKCVSRKASPAL